MRGRQSYIVYRIELTTGTVDRVRTLDADSPAKALEDRVLNGNQEYYPSGPDYIYVVLPADGHNPLYEGQHAFKLVAPKRPRLEVVCVSEAA